MTFPRVNPLGWALFELLTSAQMNQLDINVTMALDGGAGGTYTPTAALILDGVTNSGSETFKVLSPLDGQAAVFTNQPAMTDDLEPIVEIFGGGTRFIPGESLKVTGQAASVSGGLGIRAIGGQITTDVAQGGIGIFASGGTGTSLNYDGGDAIVATGGTSLGTGGPAVAAGDGIVATGGTAGAGDTAGGVGGKFRGGNSTGTKDGAPGLTAKGGKDASNVPGPGAIIELGNSGSSTAVTNPGRWALILGGVDSPNEGGCLNATYDGDPFFENALFRIEGSPTAVVKNLVVDLSLTSDPGGGGFVNTLIRAAKGTSEHTQGVYAQGTGEGAAIVAEPLANSSNVNPVAINLVPLQGAEVPDNYFPGGLVYLQGSVGGAQAITDLKDDALFMATGRQAGGRSFYDRVLGSFDPAAVMAWARVVTDGVGGVTIRDGATDPNGLGYNIFGVNITGGTDVRITLRRFLDQNFSAAFVQFKNTGGAAVSAWVTPFAGGYDIRALTAAGATHDMSANAVEFHFVAFGHPTGHTTNAVKPTETAFYP